ncbi:HPr family phosphocarrier protein [Metabacillus sp. Hm71]|uniref:HPr family phosphocarrier protein n=1 Tax=Metabacillus sp. Hm71 TaxID=3450743 RepID=UPI003F421CBF
MIAAVNCLLSKKIDHKKIIRIVSKANQFDSYILIEFGKKTLNAKSYLSTSELHDFLGSLKLYAKGHDSKLAIEALQTTLADQ